MNEFIKKLIERLEEELSPDKECFEYEDDYQYAEERHNKMLNIVNQLAEEYNNRNCMHCKYESLPITDEHCEYCMHQFNDDNFEPKVVE